MSSSHSRRVYHGVECEHRVSEIFGLERKEKRGGYQPDIYDEAQRVIGEVKAFGNHESFSVMGQICSTKRGR